MEQYNPRKELECLYKLLELENALNQITIKETGKPEENYQLKIFRYKKRIIELESMIDESDANAD